MTGRGRELLRSLLPLHAPVALRGQSWVEPRLMLGSRNTVQVSHVGERHAAAQCLHEQEVESQEPETGPRDANMGCDP